MAYNHGKAERKWKLWKEKEEKILRDSGVAEDTIEAIRLYDRQAFNSDRRYYERVQETGTYLDTVAEHLPQRESAAVVYACMVFLVAYDVITVADDCGDYTEV